MAAVKKYKKNLSEDVAYVKKTITENQRGIKKRSPEELPKLGG